MKEPEGNLFCGQKSRLGLAKRTFLRICRLKKDFLASNHVF